jgi:hypothetical protein
VDHLWEINADLVSQWSLEITWNDKDRNQAKPVFDEGGKGLFRMLEHPKRQMLSERNVSMPTYRSLIHTWQNDFTQWIWKTRRNTVRCNSNILVELAVLKTLRTEVYLPDTRGKRKSPRRMKNMATAVDVACRASPQRLATASLAQCFSTYGPRPTFGSRSYSEWVADKFHVSTYYLPTVQYFLQMR